MSNENLKENFQDTIISFIKKKLNFIISFLIVIFIVLLLFLINQNQQKKNSIKISEQYTEASLLIKQKKTAESRLLLERIISKEHQLYSPLALYLIIDNNIERDSSKIISYFNKIIENNSIEKENLNLIKIKKAIYLINLDNEKLIVETLNPIINSNSAWRLLAINIISEYFYSKNQKIKAEEYIQLLNNQNNK
mgnify:CR=1 FL=1|tara:strand:- start:7412 stop:7993 length:582 start_codon:yes stop_codon:yes gene_type:complete